MECRKCRYWGKIDDTSGKCALTEWGESDSPVNPTSFAVAISYYGSSAILLTRPTFSCNQFKAKEIKMFSFQTWRDNGN